MNNKVCTRCQQTKPVEDFYYPERRRCKVCERETARWRMGRRENKIRQSWRDAKKVAVKYGVEDTLTVEEVEYIFALADGRCAYTGKYSDRLTLEHIVPMSRGGANAFYNVIVIDAGVNRSKLDSDPSDWFQFNYGYEFESEIVELMAARKGVAVEEVQAELMEFQSKYSNELYSRYVTKQKTVATG